MDQDRTKRKLTAILSADVVGYSRMMEADEAWTIQNLEDNKKLMSSLIKEYKGRVVDAPGDNLLAEFGSVINAVECAVKIQQELNKKNSRLTEEHQMKFRIGVNLGDVVEGDSKLYGNGVNIAARLEGLAEPGGICISHTAYDQVKSKINEDYDYLGEYQVKNINEPVRVYRILMGGDSIERYFPDKTQKRINPLIISTVIMLLVIVGVISWKLKPIPNPQAYRFEYELPDDQQFFRTFIGSAELALSPDGSRFAYSTPEGIYVRAMDELNAILISGSGHDAQSLFFSPDGQWIGYFSRSDLKLKRISVNGGTPSDLCKADFVGSAKWYEDNTIVYSDLFRGIFRVSVKGGAPELLIEKPMVTDGQLLPDGKSVMFTDISNEPYKTVIQSLEKGAEPVILDFRYGRYLSIGQLVYVTEHGISTVPYDVDRLEDKGEAVSIMSGSVMGFAISDSGTIIYAPPAIGSGENAESHKRTLVWVDSNGRQEELLAPPNEYSAFKISPDGKKIALDVLIDKNDDIRIWDINRKTLMRLTSDESADYWPLWTPDGQRILFTTYGGDVGSIYWKASDGSGVSERLASWPKNIIPAPFAWASNGKTLLSWDLGLEPLQSIISTMSMDGDYKRQPLLEGKNNYDHPQVSPDEQWLAYSSAESGRQEVYVVSYPDVTKRKWLISTDGGYGPLWAQNGREIYYRNGDSIMAASVETKPVFKPGEIRKLFDGKYYYEVLGDVILPHWELCKDGRFLMLKPAVIEDKEDINESKVKDSSQKIIVITNWFEELKERVPVDQI